MKNNKPLIITLIVLCSVAAISLVVFLVLMLTGRSNFRTKMFNFSFGNKISDNLVYEDTFNYSLDLKNINIDVNMGDVEIKESNSNTIKVEIYSEKSYYNVNSSNNLAIEVKNKTCNFFCINVKRDKVIVYLPTNYENTIEITNNYGDIFVDTINSAIIKNSYGDVEVKNANSLDIEEDCGDVRIDKVVNAILENSFGDIEIDTILDGKVSIENNCGDIEIKNLSLISDSKIIDDFGNIEIGYTNDIYIDAKTDLGDVDIRNNNRNSEVTLTIENNCGDIEVNN